MKSKLQLTKTRSSGPCSSERSASPAADMVRTLSVPGSGVESGVKACRQRNRGASVSLQVLRSWQLRSKPGSIRKSCVAADHPRRNVTGNRIAVDMPQETGRLKSGVENWVCVSARPCQALPVTLLHIQQGHSGSKVARAARGYFVVKAYEHLKVSVLDVATATLLLADFMLDIDVVLTKIETWLWTMDLRMQVVVRVPLNVVCHDR